jgi:cob(I)alamin adenosyltransferase
MGNRLSKIVTRTGDDGTTGLADGTRVAKTDPCIVAIGEVDELNSLIGLLLAQTLPEDTVNTLRMIQHHLFDIGGELALPGPPVLTDRHVLVIETCCDLLNADLPALREFILPGGNAAAAVCHLARAVARRAERALVALDESRPVNPATRVYLNRLSDLLFVLARTINRIDGDTEVYWQPAKDIP